MLSPVSPPSTFTQLGGGCGDPPDADTYEETELRFKSSRTSYSKSSVLYFSFSHHLNEDLKHSHHFFLLHLFHAPLPTLLPLATSQSVFCVYESISVWFGWFFHIPYIMKSYGVCLSLSIALYLCYILLKSLHRVSDFRLWKIRDILQGIVSWINSSLPHVPSSQGFLTPFVSVL